MGNKLKKLIFMIFVFNILTGCQSLKDGLEGNKKTKSAEEFLIQKKNPLVLPPDYSKLPSPKTSLKKKSNQVFDLKKALEKDSKSNSQNDQPQTNSTFQKSIIEKIKKN